MAAMDRPSMSGVTASTVHLPPGRWTTVLEAMCALFPAIEQARWLDRMARGRVFDGDNRPLAVDAPYRVGMRVRYFREVAAETPIPFTETVIHADEHLVAVDKPHFLPVTPAGGFVEETLLARLIRRFDNPALVPLHRIDRLTAGLVLFSANPGTRAVYQALFRERLIEKRYEAIAPGLPGSVFPLVRRSRIVTGEPFFRMHEIDGDPNSETHMDVIERADACWRYALTPVTGKKHQLRVHMAALGAPILGDLLYPTLGDQDDDYARPLQLLAKSLAFADPLDGRPRIFESGLRLAF
jgi:tRNA pseudouridine32 synthase/23S rRNA pseudouridine746 synthase